MSNSSSIKQKIQYALAGLATSVVAGILVFVARPVFSEFQDSFAMREFKAYGVFGTYEKHFFSFVGKFQQFEALERNNEELSLKLAALEKQVEERRAKDDEAEAKATTEKTGEKLKKEAGSEDARLLSTIQYQTPRGVLPHQLFALAVGFFRKQDFEKAAVIFSHLIQLEDDLSFQRADVFLMNSISWYELKHFEMANEFAKKAEKFSQADLAIHRKAILWQAMIAKAEGKKKDLNAKIDLLLARYPHSEEAAWVNQGVPSKKASLVDRTVASKEAKERRPFVGAEVNAAEHHREGREGAASDAKSSEVKASSEEKSHE